MIHMRRLAALATILWAVCVVTLVQAQATGPVYRVQIEHGVTAPAAGLIRRALQQAEAAQAQALIIELSEGGAVVDVARPLARELHAAKVPVVVWIGPRGTDGGAAGALLLAAAHLAVMAPDVSAGFAQPLVQVAGDFSAQTQGRVVDEVSTELAGWQHDRNRNSDWIDQAARGGAIITTEQAQQLDPPLIDFVAADERELLTTLEGRRVTLQNGNERQLYTLGTQPVGINASAWEGLSQLLALPTIAFVCFVLGALALALEASVPGIGVPGVSGGVLVIAALYGFVQAQVRPLGVFALIVGLILLCAEPLVVAHGALGAAGVVLLVLGALWLNDPSRSPGLGVAPLALVGTVLLLSAALGALVVLVVRVRRRVPTTGVNALIGQIAEVRQPIDPEGLVFVNGALWQAWSDQGTFGQGELVEVAGIENLRLYVVPVRVPDAADAAYGKG